MKLLMLGIINVNIASPLAYSQLSPIHRFTDSPARSAFLPFRKARRFVRVASGFKAEC
jgi:hypothetical protein